MNEKGLGYVVGRHGGSHALKERLLLVLDRVRERRSEHTLPLHETKQLVGKIREEIAKRIRYRLRMKRNKKFLEQLQPRIL